MWHIHRLINIETGEIRPFTIDLAHQIHEFRALVAAITRAQVRRSLAGLRPVRTVEPAAEAADEMGVMAAHFFEKAVGE
jgi:hypothetical protein